MGWQDRDWAKLGDDELEALYGARRSRTFSTRHVVWGATAALVLAVGGWGFSHRETAVPNAPVASGSLWGEPATFEGAPGWCTEYELDSNGVWLCDEFDYPSPQWRFLRAQPYDGPCAHLKADQTTGRWICLSARPAGAPPAEPSGGEGA